MPKPELPEALIAARQGLSPAERAMRAKLAANTRWAKTEDRTASTEPGRRAAEARFEREVDPEGKLPPSERAKRAANLRKAHMQRMALKSAQVRRARRGAA